MDSKSIRREACDTEAGMERAGCSFSVKANKATEIVIPTMYKINQISSVRTLLNCSWRMRTMVASLMMLLAGCATGISQAPTGSADHPAADQPATPATRQLDARQVERIKRLMTPLIQNMNHPLPLNQVQLTIVEDKRINAANAGSGKFYVTTGLLEGANDAQLLGVLAHEVAHEDLGHVAKAQAIGTGLNLGIIILDQIIPGSGSITPVVADLGVMKPFSRSEEYEADKHGVDILNRTGNPGKQIMIDTLNWLLQTSGPSGGFFQTHPGTDDRIQRLQDLQ